MASIYQFFPPPVYWQQFEELTAAIAGKVFDDKRPQMFGRPGQAQHGVDITVFSPTTKERIAIQCKRMDEHDDNNRPYPGGVITAKFMADEYEKLTGFSATINHWILATTAKRDAVAQKASFLLDDRSRDQGNCRVSLWFWDDYVTDLNRHLDLANFYYGQILKVRGKRDIDRMILDLGSYALSRPAFQDPLHDENPDDFLQAVKDTIRAFNTGELVDRQTGRVIRRAIGGCRSLDDPTWRQACKQVQENLQKLKDTFHSAIGTPALKQKSHGLIIAPRLRQRLEILRGDCIRDFNGVLKLAGLPPV